MKQNRQPTKIMVTILGSPYSEYLINYTDNLARKLNISWLALYVKTPKSLSPEEKILLEKNFKLIENLNAEIVVIESENIFEAIALSAKQNNISQLVLGRAIKKSSLLNWLTDPQRKILNIYPEVDIITINTGRKFYGPSFLNQTNFLKWDLDRSKLPTTLFSLTFFTLINFILVDYIDYRSLGMIYLLGITISAAIFKKYSTLIGTFLSTLIWNFLFIPPRFTLHTYSREDWAMLLIFFVIAFIVGVNTKRLKDNESILLFENINKNNLYSLLKALSGEKNLEDTLLLAQEIILDKLNIQSKIVINFRKLTKLNIPSIDNINIVKIDFIKNKVNLGHIELEKLKFEQLNIEDRIYLDTLIQQLKITIINDHSQFEIEQINLKKESEKIFQALLSSVSHELRTPLSAIKGFASALKNPIIGQSKEIQNEIGDEIIDGVDRLDSLVQNLLDMSRIDSGQLILKKTEIDPNDLIHSSVLKNKKRFPNRTIEINLQNSLSYIVGDFVLLQQTIENIIRNACLYTTGKIIINTIYEPTFLKIEITDEGPGIKNIDQIFNKFYRENPNTPGGIGLGLNLCKNIVELHHGQLTVKNTQPHGALFEIKLPKVDYDTSI